MAPGSNGQAPPVTEQYLARAKGFIENKDYRKAILALQKARDACKCQAALHDGDSKCHSTTKSCLLESVLKASISEDWDAIYKTATGPCQCGTRKLSCDREAHVDALDKLALCSLAIGKPNSAMSFAAAAIDLCPSSPMGYCRLAQVLRQAKDSEGSLIADVSNNDLVLGIVKQGLYNVQNHGSVQHPLYSVLQTIRKKVVRSDPFAYLPVELKIMVCSHLNTLDLIRCMRVSKGWLKAIRDDPELWKRIYLPLPLRPRSNPSRVKGVLRLLNRARRISSLAFSGISLNDKQYEQIIPALPELRHLHIEDLSPQLNYLGPGWSTPSWKSQTFLTRLTFHVSRYPQDTRTETLLELILGSCRSTLVELQLFAADWNPYGLPKLKVLRLNLENERVEVFTGDIIDNTPSLEQICFDGKGLVDWPWRWDDVTTRPSWPNLKVLVLGKGMVSKGPFSMHLPEGIRVIDDLSESLDDTPELADLMQNACTWAELEHFRCKQTIHPDDLEQMLQPSIASGTLKTLHTSNASFTLPSDHIQVIGLGEVASLARSPPLQSQRQETYPKWLDLYPNAHTISVSPEPGTPVSPSLFKALINRPRTKRIFQTVLRGVDWDEIQQLAKERGVVVHNTDFPAYFPWHLDDQTTLANQAGTQDVVEKWKFNRGWVINKVTSVVNQPFFRE